MDEKGLSMERVKVVDSAVYGVLVGNNCWHRNRDHYITYTHESPFWNPTTESIIVIYKYTVSIKEDALYYC